MSYHVMMSSSSTIRKSSPMEYWVPASRSVLPQKSFEAPFPTAQPKDALRCANAQHV